jgi:membrane fusion protein
MLASRQNLQTLEQQRISAMSQANQARADLARLAIDGARDVSDIQSNIQGLAQQKTQLLAEQAYVIVAPVAGRVSALLSAEGRSMAAGMPLLTIIPERTDLRADLYAPTRAIGFVRAGQEARLLYDAFPYQRFGSFGAKVTSVSKIVLDPRDIDVPLKFEEPVYRVAVTLDRQSVDAFGERLPLQPGMTLRANIVLERQSFLSWLLSPLHAVVNRT